MWQGSVPLNRFRSIDHRHCLVGVAFEIPNRLRLRQTVQTILRNHSGNTLGNCQSYIPAVVKLSCGDQNRPGEPCTDSQRMAPYPSQAWQVLFQCHVGTMLGSSQFLPSSSSRSHRLQPCTWSAVPAPRVRRKTQSVVHPETTPAASPCRMPHRSAVAPQDWG